MQISELYTLYTQHPFVTTDSRTCPPGSIFFALKGELFDGNAFAEKALEAGCAYAVVDDAARFANKHPYDHVATNTPTSRQTNSRIILVDDVLTTLQQLAALHRKTIGIPVIAITGTNGKTTTKELVAAVLSKKFNTLFTQGNLNNHIGLPLTLLRLTPEHEIAVIEMGANHPGEIRELAEIARPDYGLITNIGYAHLEGFGSFENIVRTKGELYDFLRKTNGKVFINRDDEILTKIAGGLTGISYGKFRLSGDDSAKPANIQPDSCLPKHNEFPTPHFPPPPIRANNQSIKGNNPSISGEIADCQPFLSFRWKEQNEQSYDVRTHFIGGYNLWNILATITIGRFFNVPPKDINRAITDYEPSNLRSQFKKTAKNELIIDAYNANPSSMQAALENFAASDAALDVDPEVSLNASPDTASEITTCAGSASETVNSTSNVFNRRSPPLPRAVILGDMLELGEISAELHAAIVAQLRKYHFDKTWLCGKQFTAAVKQAFASATGQNSVTATRQEIRCFPNIEALNAYIDANPLQGYRILIKGSRGIQLEKIIEKL